MFSRFGLLASHEFLSFLILHSAIELFNSKGIEIIRSKTGLKDFDNFILAYFYNGLKVNEK